MNSKYAQASTEYCILLALFFIVALVVITLLNLFPDVGTVPSVSQSRNFWSIQARPFTVDDVFYDKDTGRIYMAIKSPSYETPLQITAIRLNNTPVALFQYVPNATEGV